MSYQNIKSILFVKIMDISFNSKTQPNAIHNSKYSWITC